jgi:hypothetical protein
MRFKPNGTHLQDSSRVIFIIGNTANTVATMKHDWFQAMVHLGFLCKVAGSKRPTVFFFNLLALAPTEKQIAANSYSGCDQDANNCSSCGATF